VRPEDVVGAVLRGVLVSRHKGSSRTLRRVGHGHLLSPRNILAAAAAAWGMYEAMQDSGRRDTGTPAHPTSPPTGPLPPTPTAGTGEAPSAPPPLPAPTGVPAAVRADGLAPDVVRLVRLLIAAARADGDLRPEEGALIARHAAEAGAEALVRAELQAQPDLADVVGSVKDAAAAAELYSLAFAVLRADEDVNGDERRWLEDLERLLGLDPTTARRLEEAVARGIDANEAS
jgi:tellurite resistance protein